MKRQATLPFGDFNPAFGLEQGMLLPIYKLEEALFVCVLAGVTPAGFFAALTRYALISFSRVLT